MFDNNRYPEEIQTDWLTGQNIPDDPEEALRYWMEDATAGKISTNSKQKWIGTLNASIADFELPEDWRVTVPKGKAKVKTRNKDKFSTVAVITGESIREAKLQKGISQQQLSTLLHKSQGCIMNIEVGRYKIKPKGLALLASVPDNLAVLLG